MAKKAETLNVDEPYKISIINEQPYKESMPSPKASSPKRNLASCSSMRTQNLSLRAKPIMVE